MKERSSSDGSRERRGIALVAVLYFLVICGVLSAAVVFAERASMRDGGASANDARLLAAADDALFSTVSAWDAPARARQPVGTTVVLSPTAVSGTVASIYVTRLTTEIFSIVAEARDPLDGASRRANLIVRVPFPTSRLRAPLVSEVDVTLGPNVRLLVDSAGCGDSATAALILPPSATLSIDPAMPAELRPSVARDSTIASSIFDDLAIAADVRLASGAHITAAPVVSGGSCIATDENWGDPSLLTSPCASRAPVVVAAGDLTIDGGLGQGVLLVAGHLVIAGPFTYSGQIVAREGIEDRADNITISGIVSAARAATDTDSVHAISQNVTLTHRTTVRYSGCDAWHGMASWLQPRRVRERAWSELF